MNGISMKRAEAIAAAWPHAENQDHAMRMAGVTATDKRYLNRLRRRTEDLLEITLPTHNDKFCTHKDISCPSTLDIRKARKFKDFIVTSHTNNSPVDRGFLKALELFSERVSGQILVVPIKYLNKDSMSDMSEASWDSEIYKYALTEDLNIGRNLVISAHRMRPTAINPLAGKQDLNGEKSAIYGHPQVAEQSVGTPKHELPKVMMTTGSINKPVYSATNYGGKAAFHHSISAVYVKKVGSVFYHIQLGWDGNGFQFLDEYWTAQGMSKAHAEIVHGDIHADHECKKITKSKLRLIDRVKPKIQVFHDLHNHTVGSHHNTFREKVELAEAGRLKVEDEVRMSIDYIERIGKGTKNYIIGSNHNDHLDQWFNRFKPKDDPINAKFYAFLLSSMESGKSLLQTCFESWGCKEHYEFASTNHRLDIHGIDCSQHGHKGVNGARGSILSFAKTMLKTIIGHGHGKGINKGCWQVGRSCGDMGYATGYSTWTYTDCLVYTNGKRALVDHINGKTIADFV